MAISEDGTTPGAFTGYTASGTLTVTTSSFSPPSSSLVVAIVSIGHASGTPSVTVTDSGSHSWNTGPVISGTNTWAGIYWIYLAGGASNITVSAKNSTSQGQDTQLDVRVLDGAASSQAGAGSSTTTGQSTSWTGNITTTTAHSWVYISGTGNYEYAATPNSGTTTLNRYEAAAGSTSLSGRQTSATGTTTPGVTNFGWDAGATQYYAWAALEILPAAGGLSGSAADTISATGKAAGHKGGTSAADYISATGKVSGTKTAKGAAKDYISATGKAATANPQVVNQWAASYGQGTTFTTITSALQSCVVALNHSDSVSGTGIPSEGNWLFVIASWTQTPAIAQCHVGVGDDIHEWYREYPASSASGNVRTAIAYCPNIGTFGNSVLPQYVYVAPDAEIAAINVLVVEVSGLGPWDTVSSGPGTNYAAAAESLSLSLGAPGAPSFFIGAVGGDSTAAGQTFAPSGWAALHTMSQSNGSNQLASNYLTSAFLSISSSAQSVSGAATSNTDLSGFLLGVHVTGTNPVPANHNPNWPYVITEIGLGSGFNTPDSEIAWTDVSNRPWNWDETTGIQFQLAALQATHGNIEFDNFDSDLSPLNASSPYYPDVVPGTPIRIRAALGTIGGNTVNRWYVLQRNAQAWGEEISQAYRKYCPVAITDIWAALSDVPPTFYRSEVFEDNPYAWWPLNDQPGTANVLPVSFLNAATGNTNTLNAVVAPGKGTIQGYRDTSGSNATSFTTGGGIIRPGVPPGAAIYQAGTNQGWMFGDPQSTTAAIEAGTGNPVSPNPGSASWQASGQAGTTGSNGFFLSCNDSGFPPLSGGVTVEIWFNAAYYAGGNAWFTYTGGTNWQYHPITQQPYNTPVTIWEMATSSNPVCKLQLSGGVGGGALSLITYNGASATSHSIYTASDLRSNSWHMVTVTLTTTTWEVWLDGGVGATVSGTAAGMTSAWNWLILNGDLGANGGSSAGTGLANGGNIALSHVAVYPVQLPYYRVLDHYWAAVTAFGQLPAPQSVQITWVNEEVTAAPTTPSAQVVQNGFTPDSSAGGAQIGPSGLVVGTGGYAAGNGVGLTAIVTAIAPGGITSGPSAWTAGANVFSEVIGGGTTNYQLSWPFVAWTGLAPQFAVYTANSTGSETEASVVAGNGESYTSGYGVSGAGAGVAHVSGGNGSSPPVASAIGDTVGQRIERLMRGGKVTTTNRCIDPAPLLVQAPGQQSGGVQVGASVQAIQQSDSGMLYVDNLNHLTYWQRPHLAGQYNSPVWNIGPSAGKYAYAREIEWITDPQRVWNAITIEPLSPTGANLPEYTPTSSAGVLASQTQYGAQPLQITSFLQSTTEMQSQANWLFSTYGTPLRRAEKVKIDAASNPVFWPIVLGANVGDIVTLEDWAIGGGGSVYTMRITEITRHLEYGAAASGASEVLAYAELTLDSEPASYWVSLGSLSITTTSLPGASDGTPYTTSLAATGGTGYAWTVTAGSLPAWASLNSTTGVISGTPSGTGTASFTVKVTNSAAATATQALTITTTSPAPNQPDGPAGSWTLAWNDEFNDAAGMSGPVNGLSRAKWNVGWYDGPSSPGGLGYTGTSYTASSGGGAIEYYGPGAISWPGGGNGIAFSCFAPGSGPDAGTHGSTSESGGINTAGLMNITPNTGYTVPGGISSTVIQAASIVVEVSAKFAGPNSAASEYWQFIGHYNCGNCTTPGYPDAGYYEEIDVWEERAIGTGSNANGAAYQFHLEKASSYSGGDSAPASLLSTDLSLAFHTYTIEYTYSSMTMWVDGQLVSNITPTSAECQAQWATPQYLNLQFQLLSGYTPTGTGGATPWEVKYVRVFTPL